ncbi:MAG: 1-deoxy-D-xylulose-5-phosphate reductoisomerase [Phycisphaerales bacterium]|nr:1-deoxy-D-xylulose-5-phosphate reductoisomerase [Phycisphaerales bacterium]
MTGKARVFVLGSTGSIGRNTIAVIDHLRHSGDAEFEIVGLAANSSVRELSEQAEQLGVGHVAIANLDAAENYRGPGRIYAGPSGAAELIRNNARPGDTVVAAVVGAAGIEAVIAGIECGCRIALANKETLVAAGCLVMPMAASAGVEILPVDSEHSAIFQCLHGEERLESVERIVLTASGGPFRGRSRDEMATASLEDALAHPTWSMGPKISIDSATLANKALEVIEAHWLFGLPAEQIDAIIHPQSFIHGMVEFVDGSILAQAGPPDMRTPIQLALTWPNRAVAPGQRMSWTELRELTFEQVDHDAFPMIRLAWEAIRDGGTAGAVFNAANEAAVEAFRARRLSFGGIFEAVQAACAACPPVPVVDLESILNADASARAVVQSGVNADGNLSWIS